MAMAKIKTKNRKHLARRNSATACIDTFFALGKIVNMGSRGSQYKSAFAICHTKIRGKKIHCNQRLSGCEWDKTAEARNVDKPYL
jgi:hypothetical protein